MSNKQECFDRIFQSNRIIWRLRLIRHPLPHPVPALFIYSGKRQIEKKISLVKQRHMLVLRKWLNHNKDSQTVKCRVCTDVNLWSCSRKLMENKLGSVKT